MDTPPIIVETGRAVDATVIWLHGLGADGSDFAAIVPELHLPDRLAIRFIFPHAPMRPVTINMGHAMRAWYDIVGMSPDAAEDAEGIEQTRRTIDGMLEVQHAAGIPPRRIVLAGFSQGGAMALYAGLRYPQRLAGILALSCYLPLSDTLTGALSDANRDTPVFLAHGTQDPVVPVEMGRMTRSLLDAQCSALTYREYPMPHTVAPREIQDIAQWLQDRFAETQ